MRFMAKRTAAAIERRRAAEATQCSPSIEMNSMNLARSYHDTSRSSNGSDQRSARSSANSKARACLYLLHSLPFNAKHGMSNQSLCLTARNVQFDHRCSLSERVTLSLFLSLSLQSIPIVLCNASYDIKRYIQ